MSQLKSKYGPWAVVTGASSGIGREFARQLAGDGVNVVLAARRIGRLEELSDELAKDHGVEVRTVEVDLSKPSAIEILDKATSDIEVGLTIANAGWAEPGSFLSADIETQTSIHQLNTTTPMQMSHLFGDLMVKRGRGGIILVSSTAAFGGTPYLASYSAAKAYQLALGEGLTAEYGRHGVDVLVLVPGPTKTEMADIEGIDFSVMPKMMWMDARDVAAAALKGLGRKKVLLPGRLNRVMRFMTTRLMSRNASNAMWGSMMKKATAPELL